MVELLLILAVSLAARDDAAREVDLAAQRYVHAIVTRSDDLAARRAEVGARQIALRVILERERILEIGMASEEQRKALVPMVGAQRDRWLARRAAVDREQQAAIASAIVTTSPAP